MKYFTHLVLCTLIGLGSGCSAQIDHASELLNDPEVRNLINDYPLDSHEINLANPLNYRYPFGMQALQYFGIFMGYEHDIEAFEERIMQIKQTHHALTNYDKVRVLPGDESVCNFDIVVPHRNEVFIHSEEFLSEASEYFVFKVEEGRFANDEYLNYESSCPDQKHGYSSGAVIDRTSRRIMHWMMVW